MTIPKRPPWWRLLARRRWLRELLEQAADMQFTIEQQNRRLLRYSERLLLDMPEEGIEAFKVASATHRAHNATHAERQYQQLVASVDALNQELANSKKETP